MSSIGQEAAGIEMTFGASGTQLVLDGALKGTVGDRLPNTEEVTIEKIRAAARAIAPYIKSTPTLRDHHLSERFGTNVFLKYENLQHTGAFKVRGAFNKMLSLTDAERARGVVAVSGGNHAQAVGYAGQKLGINVLTLMPDFTPENYLRQTAQYGAAIETFPTLADAFDAAEGYRLKGRTLIHPFDDEAVVCGQGTIGFEIMDQVPDVTDVLVSIGGGGLAGGISASFKLTKPAVNLWGVETKGAESMSKALAAGKPVETGSMTSIARTLGATQVGELPFRLVRKYISDVLVVSDDEAVRELKYLLDRSKILAEPASSCTIAALDKLNEKFSKDDHVVVVLCGGNLALTDLIQMQQTHSYAK